MQTPFILLIISAIALAATVHFNLPDLQFLAAICSLGSFLLLLMAAWRNTQATRQTAESKPYILLDGSNVMHWDGGKPSLEPLKHAVWSLSEQGYTPGVVFDANAGYKLFGRYMHHGALARTLHLPKRQVMVVNKGETADAFLLNVARDLNARIVTRDRFRDWAEDFPEVKKNGFLISGRYHDGAVELRL